MSSVVAICRLALSNIGAEGIDDINEASAEARACKRFYDITRDILLQSYPWRFATKTQSMAAITNDKKGVWQYAYTIPTDCMKVRWIRGEYSETDPVADDPMTPYELEGGTLYSNLSPCYLRYVWRMTDPAKYPAMFQDLLAMNLAVRLALPLTRDPKVRADAYQLSLALKGQAEAADANEQRNSYDHDSEQTGARV